MDLKYIFTNKQIVNKFIKILYKDKFKLFQKFINLKSRLQNNYFLYLNNTLIIKKELTLIS